MSRSDAYILVTCDREGCNESVEINLTFLAGGGWDERYVEQELRSRDWTKRDGGDRCPGCAEDAETEVGE